MYERKIPKNIDCGMGVIMDIIGGKWKPCLIFNIMNGFRRPSELQRLNPLASRKVLNQQLKELADHGIVTKIIYPELPPKVEYFLTPFGETLLPGIKKMDEWGVKHMESNIVEKEVV